MARTNKWTETLVDWVDGRLRQNRFANMWLGGGAGAHGGSSYRPIDGQLTQRHVCYDTSEAASPCSPSGFSSLVDNLRRIRYWQEPATWFGVETTSGLQVYIKPGLWYPSTTEYCAFAGGNSPTFTLPGVLDRIDTVYIDPSGVLHIQRGTPAVSPTITLPPIASGIPLWAVYLPPAASGVYFQVCSGYYAGQAYIERDLRPFLNLGGGGVAASGVPNAIAEGQALVSNAALQWTADATPLWKGEHSFETGIAFVGATTENSITIPDAQTQAFHIIDSGTTEFLRIDTHNNYFLIDLAGAGIKVGIGVTPTDILHTRRDTADTQVIFESTEDIELVVRGDRSNDDENKHAWISCYQDGSARWLKIGVGECGNANQGFIASYETLDIFVGSTWPATTPAMTILNTSYVGIGIIVPSEYLHIDETNTALPGPNILLDSSHSAGTEYMGGLIYAINTTHVGAIKTKELTANEYALNFMTWGASAGSALTTKMAILGSGRVGIGIATPDGTMHVWTATAGAVTAHADANDLTVENSVSGGISILVPDASDANIYFGSPSDNVGALIRWEYDQDRMIVGTADANGVLSLCSGNTVEAIKISSSQRVGIGVTPGYRLDIKDDVASGFVANFFNDGNNINRYGIRVQAGADNGAAVGSTFYFYATDGDGNVTGDLLTINGVFQLQDVSDRDRKTKIKNTKIVGLDIINGLQVRDYNWKTNPDGPVMTSFVAQEAQKVFPAMVAEAPDGTLMTARAMLIPVLAKAIQELDTRLIRLEDK